MIDILGPRRLFILLALLAVNVVFAASVYYYLQPQTVTAEKRLNGAKKKVKQTQKDIDKILVEFEQLEDQQEFFDELREDGFLTAQGRREAELMLEDIQKQSGVASAKVSISSGKLEDHDEAVKVEYAVLVSPVQIKVQAMDDVDVYRYLSILQERFPGLLIAENVVMKRFRDVDNPVLRAIATGKDVPMVSADLKLSWVTMIPEKEAEAIRASSRPKRGRR